MLCFKFHQNRTVNEEFNLSRGAQGPDFKNSKKPHTERWFYTTPKIQHSSSIRKCLKIGGADSTFGTVFSPPKGGGEGFVRFQKFGNSFI